MDRNEKLQYQQSIENYFESKRIYDLFEKLMKELVINKPSDPIDYLTKRLKDKVKDSKVYFKNLGKRVFITGSPGLERKEIALSLAENFNYECCSVRDLITREINKKLDTGRKCEKKYKSLAPGN